MELARNLKVESVSRLQPTPPRCVCPEQSVAEAVVFALGAPADAIVESLTIRPIERG